MPVSKAVVDQQLKNIGDFGVWFTKKEIKYLPEVLDEGEIISAITSGVSDGTTWLIIVTHKRVLFLDKGMLFGLKQIEIPIRQISGISHKVGLLNGSIEIASSAGKKTIAGIVKKDVVKVARIISDFVENTSHSGGQKSSSQVDTVSQLERLAELRIQGILTEEEFQSQKLKLLA